MFTPPIGKPHTDGSPAKIMKSTQFYTGHFPDAIELPPKVVYPGELEISETPSALGLKYFLDVVVPACKNKYISDNQKKDCPP